MAVVPAGVIAIASIFFMAVVPAGVTAIKQASCFMAVVPELEL